MKYSGLLISSRLEPILLLHYFAFIDLCAVHSPKLIIKSIEICSFLSMKLLLRFEGSTLHAPWQFEFLYSQPYSNISNILEH